MSQLNHPTRRKCPFCGEEILIDAEKCRFCGERINKIEADSTLPQTHLKQFSNSQPVWQFILLCLFSLGLYELYWFYKNWKFIKERNKLNISPFWRTFFTFIFAYDLFKKIFILAEEKGYTQKHSPGWITITYIGLSLLWRLLDPFWLLYLLSFLPLITVVKVLNYYWKTEQPNLKEKTRFSGGEIVVLVIGGIFLFLTFIGTFFPEQSIEQDDMESTFKISQTFRIDI